MAGRSTHSRIGTAAVAVLLLAGVGCRTADRTREACGPVEVVAPASLPSELNKVSLPPYTIEPPDVLLIEAQRLIPLPPYRVAPLDVLYLFAPGAPDKDPVNGLYPVDAEGTLSVGASYGGTIKVDGLTPAEVETAVSERLKKAGLIDPGVTATVAQSKGVQPVRGEHLVRPDGTVGLGTYGDVHVTGLTLPEAKLAVEAQLGRKLLKPEVSVDVAAYNSKHYYVITDFAGSGEQVTRLPLTGGETVLDAVANIGGLSAVSSKTLWVARPAPSGVGDQVLPVDWKAITRRGQTATNYQLMRGDRLFVMSQPVTQFDTYFARVIAPVERAFGVILLGTSTVNQIKFGPQLGGFGGPGGF